MKSLFYNICGVKVRFEFTENLFIKEYLNRELYLFNTDEENGESDITTLIYTGKSEKEKYFNTVDNYKKSQSGKFIEKKLSAKDRYTLSTYFINEERKAIILLYIPYIAKKSIFEKVISPSYLEKWNRCLIDFIHGPFIVVMQMNLMKNNKTFTHSSSINYNNSGILITAFAQAGKSTLVDYMINKTEAKLISEDFSIIDKTNIYSYPKQCRVYFKNMKESFYSQRKTEKYLDKFSFIFFDNLKWLSIEPKRILSYSDLYGMRKISNNGTLDKVILLFRDSNKVSLENIDVNKATAISTENLINEFDNIDFSNEIVNIIYGSLGYKSLYKEIYDTFRQIYSNKELIMINVPFYEDKTKFLEQMGRIINTYGIYDKS